MKTEQKTKHIQYFMQHLRMLPEPYQSQDPNRIVMAFFCVQAIAILGGLDHIDKDKIINWVYGLQIIPDVRDAALNEADCGFKGSTSVGTSFHQEQYHSTTYDTSSIAATFSALCILKTLGDDFQRVQKDAILNALGGLQNKQTGSFSCHQFESEQDMRFVYCACAISNMLDDWRAVDKQKVQEYILQCTAFDGSIGIAPGMEGQGGASYCAIASLALMGDSFLQQYPMQKIKHWFVQRQQLGFQGRVNKDPDTCYSFWNGATMSILHCANLIHQPSLHQFIYSCEFKHGGFSKFPDIFPDLLHSYYSIAWLSIAKESGLASFHEPLQIPVI